jgi:hypothetical protein
VDVQAASTWNPASLAAYDLVILTDVRELPAERGADGQPAWPALRALEDYVRAGGGLAIFSGGSLSTAFYNGPLYADGQGLSPLLLNEGPRPAPEPDKFARLNPESVQDVPMLRVFSSRGVNFSPFVRFYAHLRASPPPPEASARTGAPQVLASFDNGFPAVCRRAYGKGAVIMWYSSADTSWTNWPKDLSFLPVVNDMAWELARATENIYDDVAGRSIGYTLPARFSGALAAVIKTPAYPTEDAQALTFQDDGRQRSVCLPQPPLAGLYELALTMGDRTEHRVLFSRHPDPRESQLVKATEAEAREAAGPGCAYTPRMAVEGERPAEARPLKAFWWVFLAALLGVLAVETVLALRFGHYLRHTRPAGPEAAR